MLKLGIFVGEDNWTFFSEIYSYLSSRFETRVFKRKVYNIPILYGRLNRWKYSRDIQHLLMDNDVCFFEWASDLLAIASHMPGRSRVITRLHSFELFQWASRIDWENVDRIVVLSEAMRAMFSMMYPTHSHKLVVIHNGCALDRFVFADEKKFTFTLGMLNTITPIKRIYEIVLMVHSLVRQGYPATLRIAGNPDNDERYFAAITRIIRMLNLQDRISFDDFVHDTPAWLKDIDIFISNSYWEGQQTALIEALATGCYCLSHHWKGGDEMLPVDNLYVTENELMEKDHLLFKITGGRKKRIKGENAHERAEAEFDISATKQGIAELIENEYTLLSINGKAAIAANESAD
jgi:glycosyltransferase involved in cell wall biosynthesis